MELVKNAELFAKEKHSRSIGNNEKFHYSKHLEDVVNRLKSLGVVDEEILCSGWLHDSIENTDASFDDLYDRFGSKVAVLVSDLTKDMSLPNKKREQAYVKQLTVSSFDSKLIKLCDISANLSDLKNHDMSKSKKLRLVRQKRRYLLVIKNDLLDSTDYPKIQTLLTSIEQILKKYGSRFVKTPSNHF